MITRGSKKILERRGSNRVNSISNNNEKLQYTAAEQSAARGMGSMEYLQFKAWFENVFITRIKSIFT